MDIPVKLATYGTHDEDKQKKNTQHSTWISLCASKHK